MLEPGALTGPRLQWQHRNGPWTELPRPSAGSLADGIADIVGMRFSSSRAVPAAAVHPPAVRSVEQPLAIFSSVLLRYGLVAVIAWIGALKYTATEAVRIQTLSSTARS